MDDAFDFVVVVDNREVGKARFVKLIEDERTKDFFIINEDHFGFWYHEFTDFAIIKTHNGGDTVTIFAV